MSSPEETKTEAVEEEKTLEEQQDSKPDAENNNNENNTKAEGTDGSGKRLRSCDTDLTVVLKYHDDQGTPCQKSYNMYSQVLAKWSQYVDASLSVDMVEKHTRILTFEDVTPETFEQALNFLESHVAARSMTTDDVVRVFPFYDKYEFSSGLDLCDVVLAGYIQEELFKSGNSPPENLDKLVDIMAMAHECMMPQSVQFSIDFLKSRVTNTDSPYGCSMWTLANIQKLHPLLQHVQVMPVIQQWCGLSETEIKSPLFAKYFIKEVKSHFSKQFLKQELQLREVAILRRFGDALVPNLENLHMFYDSSQGCFVLNTHHVVDFLGQSMKIFLGKGSLSGWDWAVYAKDAAGTGP